MTKPERESTRTAPPIAAGCIAHRLRPRTVSVVRFCLPCLFLLLTTGCKDTKTVKGAPDAPRVEDMSWGPMQVTMSVMPPRVDLSRVSVVTLRITAPSEIEVRLPEFEDRVEGFVVDGYFDDEPTRPDGKTTLVRHFRLTPLLSRIHRLRPCTIRYVDKSAAPPVPGWFTTRPVLLEQVQPMKGAAQRTIDPELEPVWIHPSPRTVMIWSLSALLILVLLFLLWKLARRVRRHVELKRLSPRERALKELARLLARDLPSKDRVKDFYLELTMIVRRYIERQHFVRAPEQTTEEFLREAARHPRFTRQVLEKLKAFLESADLVKFAAYRPDRATVDKAAFNAREYIEVDASVTPTAPADGHALPKNAVQEKRL